LAPAIPEEVAREVMREIHSQIKISATNFFRQMEGVKQQVAGMGQEISDQELLKHIVGPHLDVSYRNAQEAVLSIHGIEEEDLEEAVNTYIANGDKELIAISENMKMIYKTLGGVIGDSGDEREEATGA
jgi:hypothetical protein